MVDIRDAWARQCKAARNLLKWKQEDLAKKTGLSPGTIRNFESGVAEQSIGTTAAIRAAFEKEGIEFVLENSGGSNRVGVVRTEKD